MFDEKSSAELEAVRALTHNCLATASMNRISLKIFMTKWCKHSFDIEVHLEFPEKQLSALFERVLPIRIHLKMWFLHGGTSIYHSV